MDTMRKVYQDAQAACGLKIGDWVKVVRKAEDGECGWNNPWRSVWNNAWSSVMDAVVSRTGHVRDISDTGVLVVFGAPVNNYWRFPYFVLEKVEKPVHEFKPFERVLVRDEDDMAWRCSLFSNIDKDGDFLCVSGYWDQCIPYEGNEHLLGTTDAPEE